MCIPKSKACNCWIQREENQRRAERTDPCCGSAVLCLSCVTERAICPRLTLTKVQHSPGPVYTKPSISSSYLLLGRYRECVYACGSVCLCVWGLFEWSCSGRVTLIAISTVTPGWWTAGQQALCFFLSVCAWACVLSRQKLHFYEPQMSEALCSCILGMCVIVCVLYVLQCNLPEAGMWVSVAAALRGETAAGYCLCTYCRGISRANNNFHKNAK